MNSIKLVCIGDSITLGYELDESRRWTTLLSKELDVQIINSGVNGDTTAGMLARFKQDAIVHEPKHVIITGGTNDLWFGLKDEYIISNVFTMARHAKSYNILPIIGIPTPSFNLNELSYVREDYAECLRSFQNTLINFCKESEIEYIDFSLHMTSNHVMEDGLHPNAEGHKIMMENAKELLKRLL